MNQDHLHPIDRKPPPKIRKEGPKAQERYVEEMYDEWIGGHATKDTKPAGDQPPQHIVDRYALLEEETRAKMQKADEAEARAAGHLLPTDPVVIAAMRGMFLVKKADWQEYAFGQVDPEVVAEIAECKLVVDAAS